VGDEPRPATAARDLSKIYHTPIIIFTIDRHLMFILLLGNQFGLRNAARSGSSAPKLKLRSPGETEGLVLRGGGDDKAEGPRGSPIVIVDSHSVIRVKPPGGGVGVLGQHG
jgi:hypothetical protein